MNLQEKVSVRKQYLEKVYMRVRSLNQLKEFKTVDSQITDPTEETAITTRQSDPQLGSCVTPVPFRSLTPLIDSSPTNPSPSSIFSQFLRDVLRSQGKDLTLLLPVTQKLNENFGKNCEFSLSFYTKMTRITKILSEKSENFQEIEPKIQKILKSINQELNQIDKRLQLKSSLSKINIKVVTTLKRLLQSQEQVQSLSFAYLVLLSNVDPSIGIIPQRKLVSSTVISLMQKYTLSPGKLIKACRSLPSCIQSRQISKISTKYFQEILSKVNPVILQNIDPTFSLFNLYTFLQHSLSYYHSLNTPDKKNISGPTYDLYSLSLEDRFKSFLKSQVFPNLTQLPSRLSILDKFVEEVRAELRSAILVNLCK